MKKQQHFNIPQLRSMTIAAPIEMAVMGRGTGKTTGLLSVKSANCYLGTMPRSTGLILNATYTQAYTRTLKELIRGWQMLGYHMDHHFVVCKRPSEKWIKQWKWLGPFAPPLDYKHTISWWNGAIYQVVSQDRPGSTNGMSIDHFIGDEAKLLNHDKLMHETMPANRGLILDFAGNPYHHGYTLTTDMPIGTAGRWILEYAEKMNKQKVNELLELITAEYQVKYFIKKSKGTEKKKWIDQLSMLHEEMKEVRIGLLYYHEASTLDNIHALGVEYIKQQLRDTPLFLFEIQILNLRPLRLEDGFYPDFDEEYHGYFSENESYFDNANIDVTNAVLDCRKDKDLNPDLPLHISLDYNRRIHPLEVVQKYPDEIRHIHGMDVLYPLKLKDIIIKFTEYYKPHKKKFVYFWYDHTAVSDQHETRQCDDVVRGLRKAGWIVKEMYIGNSGTGATHKLRYEMWGHLLTEDGHYKEKFRTNRENCNKCILSIQQAEATQSKDGFAKNKKPEQDPKFPADEATHHTEALDIVVWGLLESGLKYSNTLSTGNGGGIFG
jgi:hypothetical protein